MDQVADIDIVKRPFENNEDPHDNDDDDGHKRIQRTVAPGKMRLACSNCRRRRKKCDLTFPCGNCQRLKLICNVNEEDLRKKRYAASYVKSLEAHIAYLESSLKSVVDKVYPNNAQVLNNMMIGDVVSGFTGNVPSSISIKTEKAHSENGDHTSSTNPSLDARSPIYSTNFSADQNIVSAVNTSVKTYNPEKKKKTFVKGSYYPEGPVSQKSKNTLQSTSSLSVASLVSSSSSSPSTGIISDNTNTSSKERISDLNTTVIVRRIGNNDENLINNDPKILKSLSNFYKWLYPGHFIFLHRESFLYGFFNHAENNYEDSHYCSIELIYAMCAVGCRLTSDLQDMAEVYYEKSKYALLQLVFDEQSVPRITTVQALLCLAFYELGKGNNQIGWYLSGLAIRVGYEMGFQLDPQVWITEDNDPKMKLTKSELAIRSRIYWGCYIADHLICLILGRTSTLSVSNSTIPESDELPEVEGTQEFRFESKHVLQISLPLKNLIILSRIVQIFTSKIFIESNDTDKKVVYLNKFNLKVYNWRQSLPEFLKWSKTRLKDIDISTDPTISYFWYYYYIVRLIFNKPFIEDCHESKTVVIEALGDLKTLINNFKTKFNGFQKATLIQLYACLLAIKCLKQLKELDPSQSNWDQELKYFSTIFHQELSPAFELPKRIQEDTDDLIDQEKQSINQVSNINYTHDFSLSNEIDDLIKELFGIDNTTLTTDAWTTAQ